MRSSRSTNRNQKKAPRGAKKVTARRKKSSPKKGVLEVDVVRTQYIELVDTKKRPRAHLAVIDDCVEMMFFDTLPCTRLRIWHDAKGSSGVAILRSDGQPAVGITVDADGGTGFGAFGKDHLPCIQIGVNSNGEVAIRSISSKGVTDLI